MQIEGARQSFCERVFGHEAWNAAGTAIDRVVMQFALGVYAIVWNSFRKSIKRKLASPQKMVVELDEAEQGMYDGFATFLLLTEVGFAWVTIQPLRCYIGGSTCGSFASVGVYVGCCGRVRDYGRTVLSRNRPNRPVSMHRREYIVKYKHSRNLQGRWVLELREA